MFCLWVFVANMLLSTSCWSFNTLFNSFMTLNWNYGNTRICSEPRSALYHTPFQYGSLVPYVNDVIAVHFVSVVTTKYSSGLHYRHLLRTCNCFRFSEIWLFCCVRATDRTANNVPFDDTCSISEVPAKQFDCNIEVSKSRIHSSTHSDSVSQIETLNFVAWCILTDHQAIDYLTSLT